MSVGLSSDTAVFAVDTIRRWLYSESITEYADVTIIILTSACDGSNCNYNWSRFREYEFQKLADSIQKDMQVLHYPSEASSEQICKRIVPLGTRYW